MENDQLKVATFSDVPLVEIRVDVQADIDDLYFVTFLGINGQYDLNLLIPFLESLKRECNNPFIIKGMIKQRTDMVRGSLKALLKLKLVESESQHGSGFGDVMTIPAYYRIDTLTITEIQKEQ